VSDCIARRQALASLWGAALLGSGSGLAQAQASALRFSGAYGDAVFHTQNLRQFARRVAELAGSPVELGVNSQLKPMAEVLPALETGELAFGEVLMSSYGAKYPLLAIDSLPFIVRGFEDAAHMWEASRKAVGEELLAHGVRVLYAVPWPGQGLYSRIAVNQLSDLKGLRFRVYNDATKRLAELSGATAATIAAQDLSKAIETGQVDAMVTSSTTGVDSQAWKYMKFFVDLRAWIPKNMVCVSEKVWNGFSPAVRQSLLEAAKQAETQGWQMARSADEAAKKQLAEQRVQVVPPTAELRRTLDQLGERFGREWAQKAGITGTQALLGYYARRGG